MEEAFKIASAIILSFGGSSVILIGLSNWLGKVWANRILEGEKKRFAIEIENYKNKLSKEINIINSKIDKSTYVTKLKYDKEFSIYLEIWDKLASCVIHTKNLYPTYENVPIDEKELETFNKNKWIEFVNHFNEFSNAITKYSPFYEEKLYEGFIKLLNLCSQQGKIFKHYTFDIKNNLTFTHVKNKSIPPDESKKIYEEIPESIDRLQTSLQTEIRNYLKSLQTIDG